MPPSKKTPRTTKQTDNYRVQFKRNLRGKATFNAPSEMFLQALHATLPDAVLLPGQLVRIKPNGKRRYGSKKAPKPAQHDAYIGQIKGTAPSQAKGFVTFHKEAPKLSLLEDLPFQKFFMTESYSRTAIKNILRQTEKGTHEWLPCQILFDVRRYDQLLAPYIIKKDQSLFTDLQLCLRSPTWHLVFSPTVSCMEAYFSGTRRQGAPVEVVRWSASKGKWKDDTLSPGDKAVALQGHEGALYSPKGMFQNYKAEATIGEEEDGDKEMASLGMVMQNHGSTQFHNQCLYAFEQMTPHDVMVSPNPFDEPRRYINRLAQIAANFLLNPSTLADKTMVLVPFFTSIGTGTSRQKFLVEDAETMNEWFTAYSLYYKGIFAMFQQQKLKIDSIENASAWKEHRS